MTTERRINVLVVLLGIVLVVVLRPVSTELTAGGATVECDVASFVVGEDARIVTDACRDAFKGRAAAALIVLAGIAVLASQLLGGREVEHEVEVAPPARAPGEDPSLLGGLRQAAATPSFRILAGMAVAMLLVLAVVSGPALSGEPLAGSRALAIALVMAAIGVALSMLVWIVQYHRGMALGAVWHRRGAPRVVLARAGSGCATLAVLAVAIGGGAATSGPGSTAALADAPIAEDLTTAPTFAAPSPLAVPEPSGPPAVVAVPTGTTATTLRSTVTTTSPPHVPTPLTVHDASWFAASPTPLDSSTVPEGALPVGAVAGEDDVHAFFRVTGTAATLELVESESTGAQRFSEQALVRACPVIDDGWEQTSGGTFADEPAFDDTACIDAVRTGTGTWTIDLGTFDDRGGSRGFALVPAEDASTFRLTLEAQG